jgi:predicted Holliday junction resolvase-like endonuclease
MLIILVAFIFISLILLIMRVSQLNVKILSVDQQLSDVVCHEYLDDYMSIQKKDLSRQEMDEKISELRHKFTTSNT